ncbi:lipid IV(A) 3-deoxy-D-manno-octulosonic acid transferase [Andreprevotia chitinilytica]|uniref:lipid IV(A) 3-deoxy-D-manno-octulosonic acid transferase n=1 Tax=Andreprevotia chitinilytica TaxID=396808 RepID=UPI0005511C4F|nr:lipid IV(A) 3-deoxy-D-manno-octulosonic acid transferase [Andreprevotia chitinilytica]
MIRVFYSLLLYLLTPVIALYLLRRSRRQPEYRQHWRERWMLYGRGPVSATQPIWLHAVSVGEMRAAVPLVKALQARYPDRRLLLTCMTPTGRATARDLYGDTADIHYLPYDYPCAVARFLQRYRPAIGLFVDTEVWPNLLATCQRRGIPVWLVNARLSEKSARGYHRIGWLAKPAFARFTGVLAQSPSDAERLTALNAHNVQVSGNIKFDNLPDAAQVEKGRHWRTLFGDRPVLLLASSRDGEEALFTQALRAAGWSTDALLIVVPRHPQRFDEAAALLNAAGWQTQRRSQWDETPLSPAVQVLVGDSMGEMHAWFAACDVAVIGGSLLPFGSQNLIEACAIGAPVLLGPSTFNFAQSAAEAVAAGAAFQLADAAIVAEEAVALLADPASCKTMGAAGQTFAAVHRGATVRMMTALGASLPAIESKIP